MVDGCRNNAPFDPPVGPTVGDLANALADLEPFEVTSPPRDVVAHGYAGKHLELAVPNLPYEVLGDRGGDRAYFTDCIGGDIKSWISPMLSFAFYGYTGPGHVEEIWILDIEGTRLLIQANWSPDSPAEDLAEMRAILDSIRIEN